MKLKLEKLTILGIALFFYFFWSSCSPERKITVKDLQVEGYSKPMGLDVQQPRMSWKIAAKINNVRQTAYRIIVAKSPEELESEENLEWNTGKVESANSILIPYEGKGLESRNSYYWKVKVWTNKGECSWSGTGRWTMAFLDQNDWQASWIGIDSLTNQGEQLDDIVHTRLSARYLRKEFELGNTIKNAKLYISGLGIYECYLNGEKVSDDIFAPTASAYDKRVYYNTYDVTSYLQDKTNTIGVILGNGRYFAMRNKLDSRYGVPPTAHYGFPKMLMQLEVEYISGEKKTIVSDNSWKLTTKGPIVANNEFDGEEYNAHLEFPGWKRHGFDDSDWRSAILVKPPKGKLAAQRNPNLRTMEELKPISIEEVDGKYIVDMGQNMVGWLSVRLRGKKDQPVVMRFAETLKEDGSLYMANLRGAKVTNIYTPAEDGMFSWCPTFTYQGFRYAEISGIDYMPEVDDFVGKVNYDKMETIGSFESSDETINRIYKNAYWGIRGNYRSFPTDCPQRDERMAWLGDRSAGCYGESFVFDHTLLYEKWMQDIEDSQKESGSLSDVSPNYWPFYSDNITWPATFIYVANMLYEQRGEFRPIGRHYEAMKKWLDYMTDHFLNDYIIERDVYGDWCMPPESLDLIHSEDPARQTDGSILATSFYYDLLRVMSKFASINNHPEDVAYFKSLAKKVKKAYNSKFLNKENFYYGNNTVTANLVSLRQGLVPEEYKSKIFKNLTEKIEIEHDSHVGVGLIGIQFLMRGLDAYGRSDLSYKIATQKTYPSWGYMIENGATTIWELWNGNTADPAMNSRNHVMLLGDYLSWCYENLAGIKTDKEVTGFKKIIMEPVFDNDLDYVKAHTESPYGTIRSEWTRRENGLSWKIEIPANTSALVMPPSTSVDQILINGHKVETREGVSVKNKKEGFLSLKIPSGTYEIDIRNDKKISLK